MIELGLEGQVGPWSGWEMRSKRSKTFQERKPWARRFQSMEGHRVSLVTEVKAGVGRRWLEGMSGEGDSGETVKALQVRGI